ncbi:ricin-type beta-trefoil lectin domain protein [Streptomyces sp. NPDC097610]|uniref:ricin-type beta-trefoil lectin domain protein n=1 Tax=Streptomyces sp. NPDC097610 TaxID=3157227 RepID=UPI003326EAE7
MSVRSRMRHPVRYACVTAAAASLAVGLAPPASAQPSGAYRIITSTGRCAGVSSQYEALWVRPCDAQDIGQQFRFTSTTGTSSTRQIRTAYDRCLEGQGDTYGTFIAQQPCRKSDDDPKGQEFISTQLSNGKYQIKTRYNRCLEVEGSGDLGLIVQDHCFTDATQEFVLERIS